MADAAAQTQDPSPDIASLTGGMPPSSSSAIADLTKLKKQQLGEESKVIDKTDRTIDRDQERMERAFKAEGIEPETLKPWNANKEHEKFESDPIQGIGSVGGLFAVIASAFTKAPATNAIEGMAGAINAIKDGNEQAYNRAYESYKQNIKLALDRQKIEHEQYQDATSLMASNMAAGQAKMQNLAAKFGDQNTLMLLEHGMSKELFEMQAARAKSAEQLLQYNETLTKQHFQKLAVDEIAKNPPNTGNPVQDKMQMAAQIQRVYDGSSKYGSAEQEAVGRYVMAHQNDPADKFADGLAEVHQQFSPKAQGIEAYQQAKATWHAEHPDQQMSPEDDAKLLQQFGLAGTHAAGGQPKPPTENNVVAQEINKRAADYVAGGMDPHEAFDKAMKEVKAASAKPVAEGSLTEPKLVAQEVNRRTKENIAAGMDPAAAFDKAMKEVKTAQAGGAKLDEKTLDELSDQAIAGDNSVFTNLGRGKQGAENVIALRAKIAEKLAERGKTGKDQALAAAEYGGTKAALRTAATREATIGQAAFEAKKFMTIAKEASDAVPRSNLVPFNKAVQMVEAATGDPALKRFVVANNSLVNQYVRAISPTGVPTDIVRKHAYDMLATADGPKAYNAVLDIMNNEMDAAITSPAKMRDYILGTGAAPTDAPKGMDAGAKPYEGNVIEYDKDGNRIK